MKTSELREMSDDQLAVTLTETIQTLFKLRIRAQTERLDAPSELRKHRRLVARIKTIQSQRAKEAAAKENAGGKQEGPANGKSGQSNQTRQTQAV